MTFAITGRCDRTGMLGVTVTTSSICVGSRCPWVRARIGAVSTQNVTLPSLGPAILDEIEQGKSARQAIGEVIKKERHANYRQLLVVDANGQVAHYTGANILGTHNVATGIGCVAAGNLLASTDVPEAVVSSFEAGGDLHLAERLLRALQAGVNAGGEQGPTHSAALLVADEAPWPLVDLRVDWHDTDPVSELDSIWRAYQPQMQDYLSRAFNPDAAPSYGVPGDE